MNIIEFREAKEHKITYSKDGMDTDVELVTKNLEIANSYKPKEFLEHICHQLKKIDRIKYRDFFEKLNHTYRINEDLWDAVLDAVKKKLGAYEEDEYLVIP